MSGPCIVAQYLVSFQVLQSSRWGRERACCLTPIVFWMLCSCYCSLSLPRGAVGGLWCVVVTFPGHTHLFFEHVFSFIRRWLQTAMCICIKIKKMCKLDLRYREY